MRLALVLYQYFPYGGLQRDCLRLALELTQRGHRCRVYCIAWQGERPAGVDVRCLGVRALRRHTRNQRFLERVRADLSADPVDGVIGFNKMPGLDIYFAGDSCYLEKAQRDHGQLYRRSARFRHFTDWERVVFAPASDTQILLLSDAQRESFSRHYGTPEQRMHTLPPGVAPERRAPADASELRKTVRARLGLANQELTLLFVGSGFATKGLDRAITVLAHLCEQQPNVTSRLLVAGQDKPRRFQRLARRLKVADKVEFLGGRDDISDLMLAADLLVHPARDEAGGLVLLEALAAGLPVATTDVCGYAHHVRAARAGIVLSAPFAQEALDRAVMRYIDGVFRAECRGSALLYARLTDLYSMHSRGAELIETLIQRRREAVGG
jgi:UDP-glucose:(heptosyl)LPS alpha-1,3-glucosyltransferase